MRKCIAVWLEHKLGLAKRKKKQIGPSQIYAERAGWDKWTDGWMGQLGNSPETVTTTSATVVLKIRIR